MPLMRNAALEVSEYNATLKCRECEVFIGVGHFDAKPQRSPDGHGYLCRACFGTVIRRLRPGWRAVSWVHA